MADTLGDTSGTEQIIQDSIAGIETETPEPADTTGVAEAGAESETEPDEELSKLQEELVTKTPGLAGKTIDVARHQAILTRQRNQAEAKEKAFQAAVQKAEEQAKAFQDPEVQAALRALSLADTHPKAFVELILSDPRYQQLIQFKEVQDKVAEIQEAKAERPQPKRTEDGQEYWDQESLDKLLAWNRQEAIAEAEKRVAKAMEEKFGPVYDEYQARNTWNEALERNRGVLENARANWDGFKEHEPTIKKALKDNPNWDLNDAYRSVIVKVYKDSASKTEADYRKKFMEELNGKKRAAEGSLRPQQPERTAKAKDEIDTEDIILREIAKLKG